MRLLLLLGCAGCGPPPESRPTAHYETAMDVFQAARLGDVEGLREAAQGLDDPDGQVPADQQVWVDRLHGAAGFAQVAEDAEEIADAAAAIGAACGGCHAQAHPGWAVTTGAGDHWSTADGLWVALVAGDDAGFAQAQAALAERAPIDPGPWSGHGSPEADFAATLVACQSCHGLE